MAEGAGDNIFGAYQFSLDAKELAYSQLTAVIKTKTAHGMVRSLCAVHTELLPICTN
eukprot:COSAG01_NODE_55103_length_327_cov_0.982456_1_plen_56_part_10